MINQHIWLTVDPLIFTIVKDQLHLLLIQRAIEPYKHMRALPGGFVLDGETLDTAASRELREETNVKDVYLEQLYTFSTVNRDPRGRVVSCAYMALVPFKSLDIKSGSDAKHAQLFPVNALPALAFDHHDIVAYGLQRLKYKLEYTNIAQHLLPETFTLTDLQTLYQIVFAQEFDTRNFRKKIDRLGIVEPTGETIIRGAHRPAMLYKFVHKDLKIIEVI